MYKKAIKSAHILTNLAKIRLDILSRFVINVAFCNKTVAFFNKKLDAFCNKLLSHFAAILSHFVINCHDELNMKHRV